MKLRAHLKKLEAMLIEMGQSTAGSGLEISGMDKGEWIGRMERVMLVSGNLGMHLGKGYSLIALGISMLVNSKCPWLTARAPTQTQWEPSTRVTGAMTCNTEMALKSGLAQTAFLSVNLLMASETVMALGFTKISAMKVIGKTI